jgi:hypothetical protein
VRLEADKPGRRQLQKSRKEIVVKEMESEVKEIESFQLGDRYV